MTNYCRLVSYGSVPKGTKLGMTLFAIMINRLTADKEEVNFLYGNNLPKDLKSKGSVASFAAKP